MENQTHSCYDVPYDIFLLLLPSLVHLPLLTFTFILLSIQYFWIQHDVFIFFIILMYSILCYLIMYIVLLNICVYILYICIFSCTMGGSSSGGKSGCLVTGRLLVRSPGSA